MLKALLKKQFAELGRGFFYNRKTGERRSTAVAVLIIVLYAVLIVGVIGGMFAGTAFAACGFLLDMGLGWFYFSTFSLFALAFGVFGSVFNTYAGLYRAKDNDLLLSMPIPPRYILAARLLGVYLMGLMFSAIILVPAVIVYFIVAPFRFASLCGSLLLIGVISLIVFVLSCALGWLVAIINRRLKNKNLLTMILSLSFLILYFMAVSKLSEGIQALIQNAGVISEGVRHFAYPLYALGRMGEGSLGACLGCLGVTLALFAVTCYILARTFINFATAIGGTARRRGSIRQAQVRGASAALLGKEFSRFLGSPTYMLNCGLGTLFIPAAGIFLLVRGRWLRETIQVLFGAVTIEAAAPLFAVIAFLAVAMLASMNDMTAPSVSLEGQSIRIVQALPVRAWHVLRAKLQMQLILTGIPVLFCDICMMIALRLPVLWSLWLLALTLLYVVLSACFGLCVNLLAPNLSWTSEIVPIKQSMSVMVSLFGGWVFTILLGVGAYFLILRLNMSVVLFLLLCTLLLAGLSAWLLCWLRGKGARIFEQLA